MTFDAEKFMNSTTSGPMSTSVPQCPEGEYKAIVDDGDKAILFKSGSKKDGSGEWHQMTVLFSIMDDSVKAAMKRDKVLVPMNLFLDVKGDGLDTDEGKNVGLGRLRKALDQNNTAAWSPLMLKGKGPVMVKIGQRSDPNDPSVKYAEVNRVSAITT